MITTNRIAKNTLALYFRALLMMIIALYTSRVVLKALGVSDFGLFNLVGGMMVLMGFINAAMIAATQRFLNYEKGGVENVVAVRRVFAASLWNHLLIAAVVFCVAETAGLWFLNTKLTIDPDKVVAANLLYQCAVGAFLTKVIIAPYNAAIVANERMTALAYIGIFEVTMKLLLAEGMLFVPNRRLEVYSVLFLLVSLVTAATYIVYVLRRFPESRTRPRYAVNLSRQILSFASWSILSNLSVVLRLQGTNVIMNLIFGTRMNAAYGLSLQAGNALKTFTDSFVQALNPQIVKSWAAGNCIAMHEFILRGFRFAFFLMLFMMLPLILTAETLLDIWLIEVPQYTLEFVRLILVQTLLEAFSGVIGTAQGATGRVKSYHITLSVIGLLNLPISYFLLRAGAAPTSVFTVSITLSLIMTLIKMIFLHHSIKLPIRRFLTEVVNRIMLVSILSSIIPIVLYRMLSTSLANAFLIILVTCLSVLITVLTIGLKRDERQFILEKLLLISGQKRD